MKMPDISKCNGTDCPKRDTCYRFRAKPSEHLQAYFTYAPYDHGTKSCSHYWPTHSEQSRLRARQEEKAG